MRTRRMAGSCAGGWGADSFGRKIRSGTIYRADLVSFVGVAVFWGFWKKGMIYHARTNVRVVMDEPSFRIHVDRCNS